MRSSPALLLTVMVSIWLAGCGYTPLYGQLGGSKGKVAQGMNHLAIPEIPSGLVGLDVRNGLLDSMGIDGSPVNPEARLEVTLATALVGLLVQPDAAITRYNYLLSGTYRLVDSKSGKVLAEGQVRGQSAYNVVASEYATVVARRDAERRAARNISEELATRIAVYYNR